MERAEIRLKCLELAVGRTTNHQEAMARFKEYFDLVTELDTQANKITGNSMAQNGVGLTVGKNGSPPGKG